jgi:hypothetical protein
MPRLPKNWTIAIGVDVNGDIEYGGDHKKKVWRKDHLEWTSPYSFAVIFDGGKSPFKPNTPYQAANAGQSTGLKLIKKPKYKKEPFKYLAAVLYNGTILLDDPIIIVDDDGGGGGLTKAGKGVTKKKATKK